MIYTAVFQNKAGKYSFEIHTATHDRTHAWYEVEQKHADKDQCLVLLIDGQASVKTYDDIVDTDT
jgi:hypothetical protein